MKLRMPLLALAAVGCAEPWPEPPPVDAVAFAEEHEVWRLDRAEKTVTPPSGPLLWVGLWDLPEHEVTFGSSESADIRMPAEDAPPMAGTLRRRGEDVELTPAPGSPIALFEGDVVEAPTVLRHDRMEDPTRLQLGSLGLRVHSERGTDRLWLRAWDEDHPEIETFELPDYYPIDPGWRVQARLETYPEPVIIRVPDVTGGTVEYTAPGELVFEHEGREHRLIATATETSTSYFVMIWDSTATIDTYQGGRYVRPALVDEEGWTTIDFNRTYNAPCVFTAFSVCALPPRANWLTFAVSAGEKRPDKLPDPN
ncbi:MAG: DUF1684 domain-containing protein [Gemmatimonadota bacterium]